MRPKLKVLFLCTGNSCRSQMAEGFARHLLNKCIEPYSAGVLKHVVDPFAIKVMQEEGIDISNHFSKTIDELKNKKFDYIITLCDHAKETCPYFPGKTIHYSFPDPPSLSAQTQNIEEALTIYRDVRDRIKLFVLSLPNILLKAES
ncbi:protein tyrosine phosphatase [Desulfonauticus submarinus]|uniref:Protein tyrosine phosphatase n=1 Tax=Desulfonauticus submarinus TaxID=206665 RepID=A0A1H0FLW1_9BACT|nr:arsenate reductase ArsC [Desulfonauticus submarinus]SDN95574.1 protein tyrosine phosphatase [Desulfonauticus submarinus]